MLERCALRDESACVLDLFDARPVRRLQLHPHENYKAKQAPLPFLILGRVHTNCHALLVKLFVRWCLCHVDTEGPMIRRLLGQITVSDCEFEDNQKQSPTQRKSRGEIRLPRAVLEINRYPGIGRRL